MENLSKSSLRKPLSLKSNYFAFEIKESNVFMNWFDFSLFSGKFKLLLSGIGFLFVIKMKQCFYYFLRFIFTFTIIFGCLYKKCKVEERFFFNKSRNGFDNFKGLLYIAWSSWQSLFSNRHFVLSWFFNFINTITSFSSNKNNIYKKVNFIEVFKDKDSKGAAPIFCSTNKSYTLFHSNQKHFRLFSKYNSKKKKEISRRYRSNKRDLPLSPISTKIFLPLFFEITLFI